MVDRLVSMKMCTFDFLYTEFRKHLREPKNGKIYQKNTHFSLKASESLTNALQNIPIWLKINFASRFEKRFSSINVQCFKKDEINVFYLKTLEKKERRTASHLKDLVLDTLNLFNISYLSIVSITVEMALIWFHARVISA